MVLLLQLLAKRAQGHARMVFGWVLRGCTNAQHWKKKRKADLPVRTPTKTPTSTVSCICMALVWICREVREGGIWDDGIERVG